MCYNIDIMKKKLIILVAIVVIVSLLFVFAGCGESFSKNSIRMQIENNLGWHENAKEICEYDVIKDGVKLGTYRTTLELFSGSVNIATSQESVNPTLENFVGYKFTQSMKAQLDGAPFERESESYATMRMEPKLSYVKTVEGEESVEIITTYSSKKCDVTFIKNSQIKNTSDKYSKSAFIVDNTFLYHFARVTSLSSSVSVVVPTYDTQNLRVSNASFSCSYATGSSVILENKFVLNREYTQTTPSGEIASGESTNLGSADNSGDIETSTDESGNVTVKYPHTLTSVIPALNCTFTTSKSFPSNGKINCYLANSSMKMQGDSTFANRVVVRFVEGNVLYDLTSVTYTKR